MQKTVEPRWDWYSNFLFAMLVFIASGRLVVTRWTDDLGVVQSIAMTACLLGLWMGMSKFGRRGLFWLVGGYSLILIPWHLTALVEGEETALGRLGSLWGRLAYSFDLLRQSEPVEDPLLFLAAAGVLFWGLSIASGYQLNQHRKYASAVLPSALPLLLIQYYDGFRTDRIWIVAIFFFFAILLLGRLNFSDRQLAWREKRIFSGTEPAFDWNNTLLLAAAVIVFAAWTVPAPSMAIPAAARWWRERTQPIRQAQENMSDALASLRGGASPARAQRFGNVLPLGSNAGQGEDLLFRVRPPEDAWGAGARYYWRARVYESYQGGRWNTPALALRDYEPFDEEAFFTPSQAGQVGDFTFSWQSKDQAALLMPSQPLWASREGTIYFVNAEAGQQDPVILISKKPLQPGDQYVARAALTNPTRKQLREAGEKYPDWVRQRYLQLPDDFSPAVISLAQDITRNAETPYDKAQAITEYLRETIEYKEFVPSPPPGADPVEWFLLTWQNGFCNYYASAEVLMLRSLGIPARMAVGYAQGKMEKGQYVVRSVNAHAWPEVYFPGIGWVEFEPTANQIALIRPSGELIEETFDELERGPRGQLRAEALDEPIPPVPVGEDSPEATTVGALAYQRIVQWVIIVLVIAVTVWQAARMERQSQLRKRLPRALRSFYTERSLKAPVWLERWARWSETTSTEHAFHAVNQSLAWVGCPQPIHATPAERAALLCELVPQAAPQIKSLTSQLEATLYSPQTVNPLQVFQSAWKIRFYTLKRIFNRWLFGA
jgi:transglutaminase-like putative cysteine protease